ncbi:MAG: cache domain-containing protein [Lachnospiraceae bacterium]|nr:cache domain-containing protein [Candidatus Merdinaster equi]
MKETKGKANLLLIFLMAGILPMLIAVVSLVLVVSNDFKTELEEDAYSRLKACATSVRKYFEWDINEDILCKDEVSYDFIDSLTGQDIEQTLFEGDTRYITSIRNADGSRNEGTQASAEIFAQVKAGKEYRADKVTISGKQYYVYYLPVYDEVGEFWGMAFAGEPEDAIVSALNKSVMSVTLIAVGIAVACIIILIFVALAVTRPIKRISAGLATMADGNLNAEVTVTTSVKDTAELVNSALRLKNSLSEIVSQINTNMDSLNQNMVEVSTAVSTCNEAKDGITSAVEDLAKGSMEMAESVQNNASSMSEMGVQIDSISELADAANDNAKEIIGISAKAKDNLEKLMEANRETVLISDEVVDGILESQSAIEEINKATQAITSIAAQTNLLSLNASIEAARAGEAGRGFAVVAGEISNLAKQSDDSAKEIQNIVETIIQASNKNTQLANKIKASVEEEGTVLVSVNTSFGEVNDCIDKTSRNIASISDSAVELNKNKNSVLDEIANLSSISEENAASTEETSASTQELGANIENINQQTIDVNNIVYKVSEAISYFKS